MTDHIGDVNGMTRRQLDEIKARFKCYSDPKIEEMRLDDVFKLCDDVGKLLAEVERLTSELNEALAYIYGDGEEK